MTILKHAPQNHAQCESCGKSLSPNQQVILPNGRTVCIETLAHLVDAEGIDPDARVNVSADYIHRLVSGIVRFDWRQDAPRV